jgi:hypothetical protein
MPRNFRSALTVIVGAMLLPLAACSSAKGDDEIVDTTLPDEPTSSVPTDPAFAATDAAADDSQAAAAAAQSAAAAAAAADFAQSGADDPAAGNDEPAEGEDSADQPVDKGRYD